MFEISIGESGKFTIKPSEAGFSIDGRQESPDIWETGKNEWHVLYKGRSFNVGLLEYNAEFKTGVLRVNSRKYTVQVADRYDKLLKELGMQTSTASKLAELKAPMPGMVLKVLINEGDQVEKGTPLLVLEAMKMENIIKSSSAGTVKSVHINAGAKVEKNDLMISFA